MKFGSSGRGRQDFHDPGQRLTAGFREMIEASEAGGVLDRAEGSFSDAFGGHGKEAERGARERNLKSMQQCTKRRFAPLNRLLLIRSELIDHDRDDTIFDNSIAVQRAEKHFAQVEIVKSPLLEDVDAERAAMKGGKRGRHVTLMNEELFRGFGKFIGRHPTQDFRRHAAGVAQKFPQRFRHSRRNHFIHGSHDGWTVTP